MVNSYISISSIITCNTLTIIYYYHLSTNINKSVHGYRTQLSIIDIQFNLTAVTIVYLVFGYPLSFVTCHKRNKLLDI